MRRKSPEGCDLLVKLNMFDEKDEQTVNLQTKTQRWNPGLVDGLTVMPLHSFSLEQTALVAWAPGTEFNAHNAPVRRRNIGA